MTSVQPKKEGTGAKADDRQNILRQMKVRTKLKTDKSWIQRQSPEVEQDGVISPISPELKSLEGKKLLWSPTPDSKPDRNSGSFTAKEVFTSSSVSPVQAGNKQFSYSFSENNTPPSPTSKPSLPPSTTGNRPSTSYIIRGQTLNAVSQVKSPYSYNGMPKSTVQSRTTSLPRIQTATGYKMSKEEYKKLASYNVRRKSADLSDDDTPFTPQEQAKRTEQASSVLKNTTSKERSYVISAARRNSGAGAQDSATPFVAKRVEVREEISPEKKSQSLPKSLESYLYDDSNRFENSWKESQPNQTQPQTSQPSATKRSSSPRLSSYTVNTSIDSRKSPVKPEAARATVVKEERNDISKPPADRESTAAPNIRITITDSKDVSKPPAEKESTTTTNIRTTKTERNDISKPAADRESATAPNIRITITDSKDVSKPPAEKESTTTTNIRTTKTERVEVTENKSETLPHSLASFLYEDASRFENSWKANQADPPTMLSTSSSVSERPESPKLISRNPETRSSPMKPEPAKITVLREDGEKIGPKTTEDKSSTKTTRTVTTTVESGNADIPMLTSYKDITDGRSSSMQTGSGKISVVKEESQNYNRESPKPTTQSSSTTTTTRTIVESNKESSELPILMSCSMFNTLTEKPAPIMQTGPGKISIIREDSVPDGTSYDTTTRTTITTETRNQSTPPKPVPRMETKSKDRPSEKQGDLISWSDLEDSDNSVKKEKPTAAPKPVPRSINKDSEKLTPDASLIVTSPELHIKRETQPSAPASINIVNEARYQDSEFLDDPVPSHRSNQATQPSAPASIHTVHEARYKVSEYLDDPEPSTSGNRVISGPENSNVRITIETLPERPRISETERSSSPSERVTSDASLIVTSPELYSNRATQPSTSSSVSRVNETIYRVTEPLDDPEPSPRINQIAPDQGNPNVRITIETLSERPSATEPPKTERSSSPRPIPRSRESTTTTTVSETKYRVPEILDDTMLAANPARSNSRTTVTTTRSTDPVYTEYLEDRDTRSTRTMSTSREKITTTTVQTQYDITSSQDSSQYDPQSPSNKGVLFVKEYVNTSENLKSPSTAGNIPAFSGDSEMISYNTNSSYLYNSAPRRSDEGPCTYCGREIKDCAKIMLEHLNIYCHEYCFKCGICNKPMGDLIDSLFIHRDVVHCQGCYEKLF